MKKIKVEINMSVIEGYEYTGEYRTPSEGEHYLDNDRNIVEIASCDWRSMRCFILKKAQTWRKVTSLDDLGKKARFRNGSADDWSYDELYAVIHKLYSFEDSNGITYQDCEILQD